MWTFFYFLFLKCFLFFFIFSFYTCIICISALLYCFSPFLIFLYFASFFLDFFNSFLQLPCVCVCIHTCVCVYIYFCNLILWMLCHNLLFLFHGYNIMIVFFILIFFLLPACLYLLQVHSLFSLNSKVYIKYLVILDYPLVFKCETL